MRLSDTDLRELCELLTFTKQALLTEAEAVVLPNSNAAMLMRQYAERARVLRRKLKRGQGTGSDYDDTHGDIPDE